MLGLAWKQKIETSQDESFYQPSLFLSFLLKGKGQWLVRKIDSSKAGFHLLLASPLLDQSFTSIWRGTRKNSDPKEPRPPVTYMEKLTFCPPLHFFWTLGYLPFRTGTNEMVINIRANVQRKVRRPKI